MPDALIIVDMINRYDHEDADRCIAGARRAVPVIAQLASRMRERSEPVIYVNDNYGAWSSDRGRIIDDVVSRTSAPELVEAVLPDDDDKFLFKARHSIFFQTPLEYLLAQLDAQRVTLVGQVTEQCILYSALDAYVRHLDVRVVTDGVIGIDDQLADAALRMMERNMHAELTAFGELESG
jgi:nicotinamidase-related amidase